MAQNIPLGSGASAIGAALGGRGAVRRAAYDDRMGELAKAFVLAQQGRKFQTDADLGQDTLSARGDLGTAFAQAYGVPADASSGLAVLARAAKTSNPEQLASIGMRRRAMGESNPVDANQVLAAIEGKPRDLTAIQGNMAFNPTVAPEQQAGMAPTQVGIADIAAKMANAFQSRASAANSYAGAGEHSARTRLIDTQTAAGGWNPNTGRAQDRVTWPSAPDATTYLGQPENAAAFTAWRSQNPQYANGDQAWIAFRAARPIGAPTGEPAVDDGVAPVYEPAPGAVDLASILSGVTEPQDTPPAAAPEAATVQGARRAPDGNLYVPDPARPGKWLRVDG